MAYNKETRARVLATPCGSGEKVCRRCFRAKPLDDFSQDRRAKDGRRAYCQQCATPMHAKWVENNPEQVSAYVETYRVEKKDMIAAGKQKWRAANRQKHAAHSRSWRRRSRKSFLASLRRYYKNHPEKVMFLRNRRRARLAGIPGVYTQADLDLLFAQQTGKCFYCASEITRKTYQVDHKTPVSRLDLNPTNWPENLCLACRPCNASKGALTEAEFRKRDRYV